MNLDSAGAAGAVIGAEPASTRDAHVAAGHAYRPEVDGLRAVAVIPVILFHAGFNAFGGGYIGVDVFFVISGYLITSIILRERLAGRFTLASFYERRARRILPALFLVMIVCVPFAWIWMLPGELKSFGESLMAVPAFVSNLLFWRTSGYFDGAAEMKPLLHTWSLGIEEQYYVIFPLFIAWIIRRGSRWLIWSIAAVASLSFLTSIWLAAQPTANFFLLPSRAWELLAGSLLASATVAGTVFRGEPRLWDALGLFGLALILIPVFLYDETTSFPGVAAIPPVLGTMLILAYTDSRSLVGRLLTVRPMLWIGAISYSAYLWHQPLFAFARLTSADHPSIFVYTALAIAAFVLAYLSWRYVEAPFRNRRSFTRRQIFAWSVLGSAGVMAIGAALVVSDGAPTRFSPEVRRLVSPVNTVIEGCPSIGGGVYACRLGAQSKPMTIALVGDSHAYAIAQELDAALARDGRAGILLHTDCHPIFGLYDSREPPTIDRMKHCNAANEKLRTLSTASQIEGVIVAVRWTLRLYPMGDAIDAPAYDNGEGGVENDTPYRRNVGLTPGGEVSEAAEEKALAVHDYLGAFAARKKTVVLYPVPEVGWSPARRNLVKLLTDGAPFETISTSWARFQRRNAAATRLLDSISYPNLSQIHPEAHLCNTLVKGRCIVQHGGALFYSDDDHLSSAGAAPIVRDLLNKLGHPRARVSERTQ